MVVDVPVHVGDCVSATFSSTDGPQAAQLKTLTVVDAAAHKKDCS